MLLAGLRFARIILSMNDAIEVPIAEHVANILESFRTGGITVSATRIICQSK
jgi:hypothetical protein